MTPMSSFGVLARLGRQCHQWTDALTYYVLLSFFGLLCLSWSTLASLLYPLLPRRWGIPLGRVMIHWIFRLFVSAMRATGRIRCDLDVLNELRDKPGLLIAANHPGLLDAVLMVAYLPRVACIMKAEIWDNRFLGGGARLAGYLRNDSPLTLVRQGAQKLRAGEQLLVFPEGSRTRDWPASPCKKGFALMAAKSHAPIQLVYIESNQRFLGHGWPLLRRPDFPLHFRVRLGPCLEAGKVDDTLREVENCFHKALS